MVRETRHLWVGNLPENVSKERIKEYFNRYGPVQSVKHLPCKDGEVVSAVQVAFMDIKSAKKALQTTHHLEERPLKTDFYDPTSGDCGSGSCPPTPEEKGGGPGGGVAPVKLEQSRTSQPYYRGHGTRPHPSSRYPETPDYRHRPARPPPYRSNSSFSQDSGSSSYRNNYGWKDSRPRPADQTSYNSGEKSEPGRLVNSKPVNGGGGPALLPLGQTSLPQHKKKQHRARRSRSNSSSDSQQSGSNSRSSSSSSSRSSSSGSGSSKSPSPSRSRLGKGLGQCLPHTEFDKLCTIYVRNLPDKPTDHALKEELGRDYQKGGCAVRSVRIVEKRGQTGSGRNAIITFRDPADVSKALEDSRNKRIFGSLIDVEKFTAHQDDRPRDGELSEFHPKATRTLFVGNISREVRDIHIHQRFKEFGEILLIDIKKPDYALVQFFDIKSVIKAIKAADGELIGGQRVCLKFGQSVATKCVWVDGVAAEVSENSLQKEFSQFGRIQNLIIDRSRGHALVYFDQLKKATIAVSEVRGLSIHGSKLMTDYASYECRTAFFEHCKKSGMDIRERSRTWEQETDSTDRRSERIHRERSNESRGSGTSRTGGRKGRDEYDEELRRFQNDRGKIESETERCFTPPYASSRRGLLSGGPSRSPSPPRGVAGPSPSNSRSDRDRAFSDRDSVVSDGSRHGSPVSREGWRSRYKPRTQAISPPGDSRSPAEPDSDSRRAKRYRLENGEAGDYRGRSRPSATGVPPQDPRIEAEQGEKKSEYKMLGVDSGLSEDTSSGSSGSVPDVDNAKLPSRSQHVRRSSSDSAVSRDESSRPPTPSISHIPVYTSNSSLLRVVPALADCEAGLGYGAPKTPVSPPGSSEGSRPGTPLCDENPENLMSRSVAAPVRLAASHLRHQQSSEPMSLPLPRFAQHVLSTSPGERSQRSQQISPREPRTEPSGQTVNPLKQARPELPKLKIVSPTKCGQPSSAELRGRDPRLKSPSLKSPGLPPPLKSPCSAVPLAVPVGGKTPTSLTVKVGGGLSSSDCKPKDPRLVTGLLTVAVPPGATASPASPSPGSRGVQAGPATPEPSQGAASGETGETNTMDIDERIKLLKERFDAWDGHTKQLGSGSARQDQASKFNIERRPSQPSAIVQQLLKRKSVFDEDSRRLERTNEPSETDQGGRTSGVPSVPSTPSTPSTPGLSFNSSTATSSSGSTTTVPVRETTVKPESATPSPSSEKSSGLAALSESVQTSLPREIPTMPLPSLSPVRSSSGKVPPQYPPVRQNSAVSPSPNTRQFFPSPVQNSKVTEDPSTRPLPLPSKAGTSVSAVTFPIKPLVDKLSKPAAFTKPSATVTPTLKSTGLTASSVKPTVFTTTSTKTVSTSTMVPSAQHLVKAVEKGEASSTTCSPKPDSAPSELTTVTSSLTSQDTDSDPNVTSTTGTESKKKVDKDIKTIKKEFDSLTSFKEKKDMREELFAPTATIIQQVKPKYEKIEKKTNNSSKFDLFDVKKTKDKFLKDKMLSSKEKKDKLKVKQKNDLKGFLTAEATIRKDPKKDLDERKVGEKKPEGKKEEKIDTKRRLSVNSEADDLEPKSKVAKLKSESDCESEAKKLKTEPMKPMGRIPKLEKKEDKRERTDSTRSLDSNVDKEKDKDKHKSHSKSKSKHEDRHRHKSSDRTEDRIKDARHKKKKREKDKDRDKDKEVKPKVDASKSRSISTDDDKHHKKPKKSKDSKHRDKKDFKTESRGDRIREKEKKDKHREKDKEKEKERKRKKEDEERRKAEQRKKKKPNDSSNSGNSDDSSDGEDRKFSIFEEPVFDENNPVYFSMYDKVKARRSCVKAKEEEEQKRQEEALKKFAKLKAQRAKREGKKKSVDSDDSLTDEEMPSFEEDLEQKSKKKPSLIESSSDSDEDENKMKMKKKSKSLGSPENRKRSFKPKRTFVDSSDDDSDGETKKPTSKSLSKRPGLDSSDSDNIMESPEVSMKKNSFLESDSEREVKTKIKSESDICDNDQSSLSKLKSKSTSDTDSEVDQKPSLALLSKSKHKSKDKTSVKVEPLSTDSEDEKVDVSKFAIKREIKKEIKSEKSSVKDSKGFDGKSKGIPSKKDKKKSKDENQKEKSILGQKLKRANLFGTSSEDESTSRTTKPPTPVTSSSKLMPTDLPAKPAKLNIEQIYSDSEPDKRNDSPAIESDSSDGMPSRPVTPTFPSVKIEESKTKASDEMEEIPVKAASSKENKTAGSSSDKMFDSLLTIDVDSHSKQSARKSPSGLAKSPGSQKSPGKTVNSAGTTTLSPGSHRSPLISPGGKPTYVLAQMHDKVASMQAEKFHRAQEKETKKKVVDKTSKDSFKTKKDVAEVSKKIEVKQTKSVREKLDQDGKMEVPNKSTEDKKPETLCLSETDSDSNEIIFKKETTATVEELKVKTEEQRKSKNSSKLSSRQASDESTDENSLVIDLDSKKEKEKSVFDFNDDSEEGFDSKPSLESGRKPLREAFKISPKAAQTSYASFAAGTNSEASSSPSAATEFKNVVILSDESPTSNESCRKSPTDDLVILEEKETSEAEEEKPELSKQQLLENSIASITGEPKPDVLSESGANFLQSAAETERKRTVISQEETESAVNALLGESFDSFDADTAGGSQVENMDEDPVNTLADDEAAAAVAGLATEMSAGPEDWQRNEKVPARNNAVDKQEVESIENIAAEIRRSSTEEKTGTVEKAPVSKSESSVATKVETAKKVEVTKPAEKETKLVKTPEVEQPAVRSQLTEIKEKETKTEEKPKVLVASPEVTEAAAPALESKHQTRVIPVGPAPLKVVTGAPVSPSKSSPAVPTPSTIVVPTTATPLVSKETTQTTPASPLQPLRLSIDETLSPSLTISSPSSRSPRQRMRRSTGGNSRESEEESAQTKQKINLILQHAKQEAERAAQHQPVAGLPINLISTAATNTAGSQELLIDPKTGQAVRLASPASSVTLTLVTNSGAGEQPRALVATGGPRAGVPQPTVLPPRHEQQGRPQARVMTAPVRPPVPLPIQLPTQPLPPESVRKTQPVLLEHNSAAKVGSVNSNLPRTVSLPTEPVPMSVASKMTSLPRTPLPLTSSHLVTARQIPQTVTSSARPSPAVSSASRLPAPHLAGPEGQRTLLGKRDDEMEAEPLALQTSQVKIHPRPLQPRDREQPLHRPSSTPLTSNTKEEEKPQPPPAAHVFPVPSSHPQMLDSPEYQAMELWRQRIELTQRLVAAGTPEHLVQSYVEKLLGERMMMEMMSQAARGQPVHEEPRPGSVPPMMRHLEELRLQSSRQPLPAHSDPYRSESPMFPPHLSHPYPGPHLGEQYRDLVPPAAHQPAMRLTQSPGVSDYSTRSRPASPTYTTDYNLPHLANYPICWTGTLGLKNEMANVRMHYVAGNRDLAMASLPTRGSTLKIMQRMRLEDSQLEGVARKMETAGEHCMLLALPNGSEHEEIEHQSRNLRHSFITYLQLKAAAGIVNVSNEDNQPAYIVHVFPSCDFANVNLARIAPNLLHRVADIEHLVIVIATVFDNR